MRGLKFVAIAAVSLLIVTCILVGYLFLTAEVQVSNIQVQGMSAAEQSETFEALIHSIDQDTFYGTLFQKPTEWKDASEYVILTYTISLNNGCLVPIDMIEAQIIPQSFDILQLPTLDVKSLEAKSRGDLQIQLLAPKDSHSIREIIVTYYLWGVSGSIKTVYGK